jgi:hypothetical protein
MMHKAYVSCWEHRVSDRRKVDFVFTSNPAGAMTLESRDDANVEARIFNGYGIVIPSNQGGSHTITNWMVEELESGKFAIFCMGPFIPEQSKGLAKAPADFHEGDMVEEIATKRRGEIDLIVCEGPIGRTVPNQWRVRFDDNGEWKNFLQINQLRLIECPHGGSGDLSISPLEGF